MATWSENKEKSTSSEGEHAHMCFMAHTHEDNVTSSDDYSNSLSYNELKCGYKKLVKAYNKLLAKYDKTRKINIKLNDENDCLLLDNDELKLEVNRSTCTLTGYS